MPVQVGKSPNCTGSFATESRFTFTYMMSFFSMEECYHRLLVAVRLLNKAMLLLPVLLTWIIFVIPWWRSTDSEDARRQQQQRARASARAVRDSLPVATYGQTTVLLEKEGEEVSTTCAVCLEEVRRQDLVRELRSCSHVFHQRCLDRWLDHHDRMTCPLCRAPLLLVAQAHDQPPPSNPEPPSWAVERLLYLFGDDLLFLAPSHCS